MICIRSGIMANEKTQARIRKIRLMCALVMKFSKSDLEKRLKGHKPNISLLGYGVLRILNKEKCTLAQLSSKMMLSAATLVPVIDSLEKTKLIVKQKDPTDRRRTPLAGTEKGRKLIENIPAVSENDLFPRALSELGEKDSDRLIALLHKLIKSMIVNKKGKEHLARLLEE
jgi:DNA-binding MarR family transcriptional regulator